jgi:hypothetical protein
MGSRGPWAAGCGIVAALLSGGAAAYGQTPKSAYSAIAPLANT